MGQVEEIIAAAADESVSLASILRKCLILAFELNHDDLKKWVLGELDGFSADDKEGLPPHRTFRITAQGLLLGPFGAQIPDQPLASFVMDEEHRFWATTAYALEGVAAYEALVTKDPTGNARVYWPADLVAHYQTKFIDGYALNRAWQLIPIPAIGAMLDTVRTKTLQFALELRKRGLDLPAQMAMSGPVVNHVFHTVIYGGTAIVGTATAHTMNVADHQVVVAGDFPSLRLGLGSQGVPEYEIQRLYKLLEVDEMAAKETGKPTPSLLEWAATAAKMIAKEGGQAALDVAKAAVTTALNSYLGLTPS